MNWHLLRIDVFFRWMEIDVVLVVCRYALVGEIVVLILCPFFHVVLGRPSLRLLREFHTRACRSMSYTASLKLFEGNLHCWDSLQYGRMPDTKQACNGRSGHGNPSLLLNQSSAII